ncbi:hypothetical protein K458DRAFT_97464 [Lentithecium fluviatile CBS 122367]|uniref:Uncharacterized protein n=1 Tax=Lentithecium fluviatile CBS 122367 TaxID=1168545 RepID=A0A6G1JIK6_9PLEO|nr:hypothetical protein K458DRAFT_97464 [Lentithecium fluviatile CBS 122367]
MLGSETNKEATNHHHAEPGQCLPSRDRFASWLSTRRGHQICEEPRRCREHGRMAHTVYLTDPTEDRSDNGSNYYPASMAIRADTKSLPTLREAVGGIIRESYRASRRTIYIMQLPRTEIGFSLGRQIFQHLRCVPTLSCSSDRRTQTILLASLGHEVKNTNGRSVVPRHMQATPSTIYPESAASIISLNPARRAVSTCL